MWQTRFSQECFLAISAKPHDYHCTENEGEKKYFFIAMLDLQIIPFHLKLCKLYDDNISIKYLLQPTMSGHYSLPGAFPVCSRLPI